MACKVKRSAEKARRKFRRLLRPMHLLNNIEHVSGYAHRDWRSNTLLQLVLSMEEICFL